MHARISAACRPTSHEPLLSLGRVCGCTLVAGHLVCPAVMAVSVGSLAAEVGQSAVLLHRGWHEQERRMCLQNKNTAGAISYLSKSLNYKTANVRINLQGKQKHLYFTPIFETYVTVLCKIM